MKPLIYSIEHRKPAIAHWLIDHRGQHDVNTHDRWRMTALHWACCKGPLSIVKALVANGADLSRTDLALMTPLMNASERGHSDIVAYLLQLSAVRATVDTVNIYGFTALSYTSGAWSASCVQLVLDAGADPTIHDGVESPLNLAIRLGRTAVVDLLRHVIAEPNRARALHKARSLLDAAIVINKARRDAHDDGHAPAVQQQKAIVAAPVYLEGRVEQDEALPACAGALAAAGQRAAAGDGGVCAGAGGGGRGVCGAASGSVQGNAGVPAAGVGGQGAGGAAGVVKAGRSTYLGSREEGRRELL